MALVLDTGVLLAGLDEGEPQHEDCARLLAGIEERLIIPEPVLVELDYWLRKAANADVWLTFCENLHADAYVLSPVGPDLLLAAAQLQVRYADQPIGFVDAAVFVTCEALGEDKVATLDVRDFSILRTSGGQSLRLLPEVG